jgi:hypothetical protein
MSTEPQNASHAPNEVPRHSDVSFEERDIQAGTIYWYLFALALATVAALVISIFILRFTSNLAASSDAPPPPSREALGKDFRAMPPEPRLQGVPGHESDPQKDLREKLKADNAANEKLEWIDKNAGIAQIPVKDAMKIIEEIGLPAAPVPPAEKKK